jgi:prepilin-type N-terminal cleavage/methylation domain-containing protein
VTPNRLTRSHGMTLIEVIVALVLLTIGLFGVLDMYLGVANGLASSQKETQADYLARAHLANLEMAGYQSLDDWIRMYADKKNPNQASRYNKLENSLVPGFTWNANLKREGDGGDGYIMITVAVQCPGKGKARERKAIGYVFGP